MTSPRGPVRRPPARLAAAALSLALLLPACQNGAGMGAAAGTAGLTPQQQQLREQSARWNQTVLTGAGVGAATGAAAGAIFGRDTRGVLIGAGVGALLGAAGGSLVANRNLAFENRELNAGQRIQSAQQIAQNLNSAATASERVTAENRRRLAQLDQQYRAGQISAAQYRGETETMRQDAEVMRKTAVEAQEARQRLVASGREVPQLMGEESKINTAQRRLEASAGDLEAALRRVPTG